ncbi:hypothetical protein ATANTOWER_017251 [Ataeniobius toweri]|uniref:Uncharacterized protein n=1 Tax=Ataeniobius toweri TaxID=208326 RepID=A0ABU7BDU9_9TELE|nr:hypothetical protein [Ataeniobius toweri]
MFTGTEAGLKAPAVMAQPPSKLKHTYRLCPEERSECANFDSLCMFTLESQSITCSYEEHIDWLQDQTGLISTVHKNCFQGHGQNGVKGKYTKRIPPKSL